MKYYIYINDIRVWLIFSDLHSILSSPTKVTNVDVQAVRLVLALVEAAAPEVYITTEITHHRQVLGLPATALPEVATVLFQNLIQATIASSGLALKTVGLAVPAIETSVNQQTETVSAYPKDCVVVLVESIVSEIVVEEGVRTAVVAEAAPPVVHPK